MVCSCVKFKVHILVGTEQGSGPRLQSHRVMKPAMHDDDPVKTGSKPKEKHKELRTDPIPPHTYDDDKPKDTMPPAPGMV